VGSGVGAGVGSLVGAAITVEAAVGSSACSGKVVDAAVGVGTTSPAQAARSMQAAMLRISHIAPDGLQFLVIVVDLHVQFIGL